MNTRSENSGIQDAPTNRVQQIVSAIIGTNKRWCCDDFIKWVAVKFNTTIDKVEKGKVGASKNISKKYFINEISVFELKGTEFTVKYCPFCGEKF